MLVSSEGEKHKTKKQKNASQCFFFPFSRLMLGAVCRRLPKGSAVVQRPASSPPTHPSNAPVSGAHQNTLPRATSCPKGTDLHFLWKNAGF